MKSVAEIAPIIEETVSVGAEEDETFEARGDENEEVALLSDNGGGALWRKVRSAAAAAAGGGVVEGRSETTPHKKPHSRRTRAWQSSPK